jgi:gas vesicle protein
MDDPKEDASYSTGWYLLGGLVIGAAAGLLLAPKKGSETLEDIDAWRKRTREKSRDMLARIGNALPSRVKAAGTFGAVKGATSEAFHESRDKAKQFVGS